MLDKDAVNYLKRDPSISGRTYTECDYAQNWAELLKIEEGYTRNHPQLWESLTLSLSKWLWSNSKKMCPFWMCLNPTISPNGGKAIHWHNLRVRTCLLGLRIRLLLKLRKCYPDIQPPTVDEPMFNNVSKFSHIWNATKLIQHLNRSPIRPYSRKWFTT